MRQEEDEAEPTNGGSGNEFEPYVQGLDFMSQILTTVEEWWAIFFSKIRV